MSSLRFVSKLSWEKKSSKTTNDKLIPFIPVSFLILLSFLFFDSGVFADAVSALLSQP
jgi:hypothetical protein